MHSQPPKCLTTRCLYSRPTTEGRPTVSTAIWLAIGGVRGVGFIRGPGLPVGQVSAGYVHAADWFHTLLRVGLYGPNVTVPSSTSAAGVRGLLPATEPPFLPGDGMDVWDSIRGVAGAAIRSEVLHEAHPHGSTEGNGAALRVGDLKIVIKTGSSWSTGSGIGSNDGWFGGPESSDNVSGSYCLNPADTVRPSTHRLYNSVPVRT
eukprot:m.316085 g.316085  ORF g.316085 m.316085 type:complete len:205 (-) comp16419_c0_seq4:739-1353(-)